MIRVMICGVVLALAACTTPPTPAQQAAIVCAVDIFGKVVAVASTTDPAAVKAVNSAVTAGAALVSDPSCPGYVPPATPAVKQ